MCKVECMQSEIRQSSARDTFRTVFILYRILCCFRCYDQRCAKVQHRPSRPTRLLLVLLSSAVSPTLPDTWPVLSLILWPSAFDQMHFCVAFSVSSLFLCKNKYIRTLLFIINAQNEILPFGSHESHRKGHIGNSTKQN